MIFFIFPQFFQHLMIFLSSTTHLALSILKNHQILQKSLEKIFQLFYYLTGRFWKQKCSQCIVWFDLVKNLCLYIPVVLLVHSVISNSKCRLWSQWSWICRLFSRSSLLSCFCWVLKSPKRTGGHKGRESINHWSLWGWIFFSNSHNHFIMVLLLVSSGKMVMLLDTLHNDSILMKNAIIIHCVNFILKYN